MMNIIYNFVNRGHEQRENNSFIFLLYNTVIFALIGTIIWLIAGRLILTEIEWLFCFAGYPAVFCGFIGGILFLFRK